MKGFVWIDDAVLLAIHDEQLAEHGGPTGIRDAGMLESALARPRNLAAYGKPGIADCAAAYAFGLAKNHPFVDGNKRTAFVALELFLALNGYDLSAADVDCVTTVWSLASGKIDEAELAAWIRANMRKR